MHKAGELLNDVNPILKATLAALAKGEGKEALERGGGGKRAEARRLLAAAKVGKRGGKKSTKKHGDMQNKSGGLDGGAGKNGGKGGRWESVVFIFSLRVLVFIAIIVVYGVCSCYLVVVFFRIIICS